MRERDDSCYHYFIFDVGKSSRQSPTTSNDEEQPSTIEEPDDDTTPFRQAVNLVIMPVIDDLKMKSKLLCLI